MVVCDNGSDAISVEGETSSRSTRGHLGVKAAPISRGHEAEGGRIADVHHQRKKTFDDIDITRSRVETNKCDELQVESRDGCEHEAILHIGEESSEKVCYFGSSHYPNTHMCITMTPHWNTFPILHTQVSPHLWVVGVGGGTDASGKEIIVVVGSFHGR